MNNYLAFTLTAFILALTPGPDVLFVIATGLRHGFKKAFTLVLGLASGIIFHTILIIVGISAVIAQTAWALQIISIFGACYLLYLAFMTFLSTRQNNQDREAVEEISGSYFWRGVIMNTTNPKVLLFFLALFPQFAQLDQPGYQLRILILGIIFQLVTIAVFGSLAYASAKSSYKLMQNKKFRLIIDWFAIFVFVVVAGLLIYSIF